MSRTSVKKIEGEWHMRLDPKHKKLYVVIKYPFAAGRKEKSSSKARCTRRCSQVPQEHISQSFQNMEHDEAKFRVELQTEHLMMTSVMESIQETSESERQAVINSQEMAAVLPKRNVASKDNLRFLESNVRTQHIENSRVLYHRQE